MITQESSLNPCCAGRCSSTTLRMIKYGLTAIVLILVVLDDALVPVRVILNKWWIPVLILVVLDDALVLF